MFVQEPMQAAIWHCMNNYSYLDAIFLAERHYNDADSDEALFLLATAYYRAGRTAQAYSLLYKKNSKMPECKYLMARCSYDMQKYSEAESILLGSDALSKQSNFDSIASDYGDQACFVFQLMGHILSKTERGPRAVDAYRRSLKLNPFLWYSFEGLSSLGDKVDPLRTFQLSNIDQVSMCLGSQPMLVSSSDNGVSAMCAINGCSLLNANESCFNGFTNCPLDNFPGDTLQIAYLPQTYFPNSTPSETNEQKGLTMRVSSIRPHVSQYSNRKEVPLQHSKPVFSQTSNTGNNSNIVPPATPTTTTTSTPTPLQSGQNVRRSSRLFTHSVKENNKSPNRGKFVAPKSPSRKTKSRLVKPNINKTNFDLNEKNRNEKEKSETITSEKIANTTSLQNAASHLLNVHRQSLDTMVRLLRLIGSAYFNIAQHNHRKAIEIFNYLPPEQYYTYWILALVGKAYHELADYEMAVMKFQESRLFDEYTTYLMEIYSTSLWFLQREVQLSSLAHDLVAIDRSSPVAWCAAGNCFSLQKEHDSAIKFFHRAVQVDPSFVYAYTLLGHEYVITEELDKAMSCFRNAIRIDSRHYNAWYGVGTIYYKQERFQLAEVHFKKALEINPNHSVLMCHIGVVQHSLQKTDKALTTLNTALNVDAKNPLCKFHRASIFFAIGRHAEALKELEELKEIVPRESLVYYLTGKVHKKLGNTHLALMHFSWATDLDPKGAHSQIKEAIDPAMGRNQQEEDRPAGDDYPSEGTSAQPQDAIAMNMIDSDESL